MNSLLTFEKIQSLTRGRWIAEPQDLSVVLKGGAFDTRSLGNAQIFFAWRGETGDGHDYLNQLAASDIRLILVEKEVARVGDKAMLRVDNSLQTLHLLARELVKGFQGKIVNITGSSGKTTTKGWLQHVINGHRNLLTNSGSFNNHIGCPITILNMDETHDVLLLEMGTSGPGEIDLLTSIAPADIALLLNVGHAHLGKFGTIENTYQAKLELFSHLKPNAIALLPFSDERLQKSIINGDKQLFGQGAPDFSWSRLKIDAQSRAQTFRFDTYYGSNTVTVPRLEDYVGELLSAILAVCYHLDLAWEQVEPGLKQLPQEKGRSMFVKGLNDVLILDDTYNANPESVIAMLNTICALEMRRRVGVVGNLAELDTDLKESAGYILEHLPDNLTDLYLSGETGKILFPLIKSRFPELAISYADSIHTLIDELTHLTDSKTVIGVKGSRTSHMERVVYALAGKPFRCPLARCGKLTMCKDCKEL